MSACLPACLPVTNPSPRLSFISLLSDDGTDVYYFHLLVLMVFTIGHALCIRLYAFIATFSTLS
jgi:hypothetical protein